jgi:hypothetical protein
LTAFPDLKPIKIEVNYNESHDLKDPNQNLLKGVLVSPYIGVKVFLNSISPMFGFPPTKVRVFKAFKYENNDVHIEEIHVKGVCTKRLADFGVN